MALDIIAWHDRTSADHQSQMNKAAAAGYRTISLCVYGDRNDPRYAASLIKRATLVAEQQFFGLGAADMQTKFNQMAALGWGPEILTATGPANNPVFAICFIQTSPIPLTRSALTAADFTTLNSAQMTAGNILKWADVYGDPGNLRYIGIWVSSTDRRAWNCDSINDPLPATQERFNALVSGFARPVHIASTPDAGNLLMYDDSAGGRWDARDGMTSADYQTHFNTLYPQGLRPIRVSAKGNGSNARFSAIFAEREDSDVRTWRMSGSAPMPEIDNAMQAVMTVNMLRGGSLAIVQGTRLVYARGYTLAETGYPDVQPTTYFRQASVSKMFTAAAIYQLIDENAHLPGSSLLLALDTPLKTALPDIANGPPVAHWNDITIRHLLEMTSGVTAGILGTDPSASSTLPVGAMAMGQWLYRQPLTNIPGDTTKVVYSNAGYMLLGMVVSRIRGAANYIGGIAPLLNKLHITRVRSAVTLASGQPSDEARYHSRPLATNRSVMATGQPLCALGYGEWNLEDVGGGGGLSAAAPDVARMLAALSVTYQNPMMSVATLHSWMANATGQGYAHGFDDVVTLDAANHLYAGDKGGSMTTSQNGVHFEMGGISTVICWNGMTPTGPNWFSPYRVLVDAARLHDWGNTDLFPSFGMPAFAVRTPKTSPHPVPQRSIAAPHMLPQTGLPKNM